MLNLYIWQNFSLSPDILCTFYDGVGALAQSMMISCALQQIEELANIGRQGEKGEFNSKQGLIHSLQRCSPA